MKHYLGYLAIATILVSAADIAPVYAQNVVEDNEQAVSDQAVLEQYAEEELPWLQTSAGDEETQQQSDADIASVEDAIETVVADDLRQTPYFTLPLSQTALIWSELLQNELSFLLDEEVMDSELTLKMYIDGGISQGEYGRHSAVKRLLEFRQLLIEKGHSAQKISFFIVRADEASENAEGDAVAGERLELFL